MSVTGGMLLGAAPMSVEERTTAVALVRDLEHELFGPGGQPSEAVVQDLNQLRATLGWLGVDSSGQWRWPY